MAHYAIGDLQGCYDELDALLKKIDFNKGSDTLWLTGDIVNRGSKSLQCLQFVIENENCVQIVLGNHDLHLLAVAYGHGRLKRSDTLDAILNHPQAKKMFDWLRCQPLMIQQQNWGMVHAGLLPQWSIDQAQALAKEVETELRGKNVNQYFANMYGSKPKSWSSSLTGYDRLRVITNVFTRMRALTLNNELDCDFKAKLIDMPDHLQAWFLAPNRKNLSHTIVFGHWSALGYVNDHQVIALDTGALWGGQLTAINLDDQNIYQIEAIHGFDWQQTL